MGLGNSNQNDNASASSSSNNVVSSSDTTHHAKPSEILNLSDYLSTEPEVFSWICNMAAPDFSLSVLENSLIPQQLECFNFCYNKCYDLDKDEMFMTSKN